MRTSFLGKTVIELEDCSSQMIMDMAERSQNPSGWRVKNYNGVYKFEAFTVLSGMIRSIRNHEAHFQFKDGRVFLVVKPDLGYAIINGTFHAFVAIVGVFVAMGSAVNHNPQGLWALLLSAYAVFWWWFISYNAANDIEREFYNLLAGT